MILFSGALLGLLSVVMGTYANHGLRAHISSEQFEFIQTALRYNQINAVMICAIGLALLASPKLSNIRTLHWSGVAFIVGTVLFSFSLYASVIFNTPALTQVTPAGGMMIMLGWGLLAYAGIRARK